MYTPSGRTRSNLRRPYTVRLKASEPSEPMEKQRKPSVRLETASYSFATPEIDIADITDAQVLEDLSLSEELKKKDDIRAFLNARGYDSAFKFCLEELHNTTPISKREDTKLRDNISQLAKACLFHPRFVLQDALLSKKICEVAGEVFRKEVTRLSASQAMNTGQNGYDVQNITTVSFDKMQTSMTELTPNLSTALRSIAYSGRKVSQVEHLTTVQSTSGTSGSAENAAEDASDDDDDLALHPLSLENLSERKPVKQKARRNRGLIVTMSIAMVCYARSQQVNLLQAHTGFFLIASQVPKPVIEVLHCMGLSMCYESITTAMTNVANGATRDLRAWCKTMPAAMVSFDNVNWLSRTQRQTLNSHAEMKNCTAGYTAANQHTRRTQMFDSLAVDRSQVDNITVYDFLPSAKNRTHQQSAFRAGISDVLFKYYGRNDTLARFRKDGRRLEGHTVEPIYQIPVGRTRIFTFPLQALNEAKIDDITEVLRVFTGLLGYVRDDIRGKKILFKGDQLTVKNMRYVCHLLLLTPAGQLLDCSRNPWMIITSIMLSQPPVSFICRCPCLACC